MHCYRRFINVYARPAGVGTGLSVLVRACACVFCACVHTAGTYRVCILRVCVCCVRAAADPPPHLSYHLPLPRPFVRKHTTVLQPAIHLR
jgi:hypothetical protein